MKSKSKRPLKKAKLPVPVYIISIILFATAAYLIISSFIGIYELLTKDIDDMLGDDPKKLEELKLKFENRDIEYSEGMLKTLLVVGIVFMEAIGIFIIILGISLLYRKNWARIIVIVLAFIFAAINLIAALFGDFISLVDFIILTVVAVYLLISKEVKKVYVKV